jgi:hypothetical protein
MVRQPRRPSGRQRGRRWREEELGRPTQVLVGSGVQCSEVEALATQGSARCYGDDEFHERGKEQRWRAAEKKKSKTATGGYIDESRPREGDT